MGKASRRNKAEQTVPVRPWRDQLRCPSRRTPDKLGSPDQRSLSRRLLLGSQVPEERLPLGSGGRRWPCPDVPAPVPVAERDTPSPKTALTDPSWLHQPSARLPLGGLWRGWETLPAPALPSKAQPLPAEERWRCWPGQRGPGAASPLPSPHSCCPPRRGSATQRAEGAAGRVLTTGGCRGRVARLGQGLWCLFPMGSPAVWHQQSPVPGQRSALVSFWGSLQVSCLLPALRITGEISASPHWGLSSPQASTPSASQFNTRPVLKARSWGLLGWFCVLLGFLVIPGVLVLPNIPW